MSWELKRLDQLGTVSRGKSKHRPRDAAHLYDGPYPFVQTGDVKRAGLYLADFEQTYSEAGLAQSKLWPKGTLCITIAANIGDTAILNIDACFPDSVIGFIPDKRKADVRFIKYLFDATLQRRYQQFTRGATQDNLSQAKLLSLPLLVPSIEEQTEIADRISAYDDLIENNRKRIKLLERAARLLYKEWFVRLRFPGCEGVKVKDGVPEGWEKSTFGAMVEQVKVSVKPEEVDSETPYIGLEHIPRRALVLDTWGNADQVTSSKFAFQEDDILFGKIRPYFHKVGFAITNGITSSDAIVMRARKSELYALALSVVSSDHFIAVASKSAKEGSKMPRADWKQMQAFPVAVPDPGTLSKFNEALGPQLAMMKVLAKQSRQLTRARDLLLPRLMSGKVKV